MKRTVTLVSLCLIVAFVLALYLLENEVQRLKRQLATLDAGLIQNQQSLQVLKAEWSYLNQPERLQNLAVGRVDRLGLKPIASDQIVTLATLPMRAKVASGLDPNSLTEVKPQRDDLPRPAFKPSAPEGLFMASTRNSR